MTIAVFISVSSHVVPSQSFRNVPERSCGAVTIHFPLLAACCVEPSEPSPGSFFCRLVFRTSHEATGAGWESEGGVAGVGTMGIWASCPHSLFAFGACSVPVLCVPLLFDDGGPCAQLTF